MTKLSSDFFPFSPIKTDSTGGCNRSSEDAVLCFSFGLLILNTVRYHMSCENKDHSLKIRWGNKVLYHRRLAIRQVKCLY